MHTHRLRLLGALLATAAMLALLPTLLNGLAPADTNRMDARLRPARMRTLTVWLLSGGMEDERLLNECCSAFERANAGVRVFLRTAAPGELTAAEAVLPDAVFFSTGDVPLPDKVFRPLGGVEGLVQGALASGQSAGVQWAVPLWLSPNVLSLPASWQTEAAMPAPTSLFGMPSPTPAAAAPPEAPPWQQLLARGALALPEGVALQQLLYLCPTHLRSRLCALAQPEAAPPSPTPLTGDSLPISRGAPSPTPPPQPARVRTLCAQLADGSGTAIALQPMVSDRVRYLALCRETDLSRAFLRYLLSGEAQAMALQRQQLPLTGAGEAAHPLIRALLIRLREGVTVPNAFAHTREELLGLCADAFLRGADPIETLLRLR